MKLRFRAGDLIQIQYKREKTPIIELVQSPYLRHEGGWLYLEKGRYRISKIKSTRNLTQEKEPPEIEDE